MTVDEIRSEIEKNFGWKMSRTRVNQILQSARRKMAEGLARAGFAPDKYYAQKANQSLETSEADTLPGDAAAIPGEN